MLTSSVVVLCLMVLGMTIGCTISSVTKPRDTSQPDQCDPKGSCNVGKKPEVLK